MKIPTLKEQQVVLTVETEFLPSGFVNKIHTLEAYRCACVLQTTSMKLNLKDCSIRAIKSGYSLRSPHH